MEMDWPATGGSKGLRKIERQVDCLAMRASFGMAMGEATRTITVVQSIVSFVGLLMVLLFDMLLHLG